MTDSTAHTGKGARTKAAILDAALTLFRERGYEETTMRAIAEEAGVSIGNAYYYFRSKEHLVQGFYDRTHVLHLEACRPVLAATEDLSERLKGVLRTKIETAAPYHRLSGLLFKTAADPKSPLNPFSDASSEVRGEATALMTEVLVGSNARIPKDLRGELPELLWLYEMAVILFWIHDDSEGQVRTERLIDRTVDMVCRMITVAGLPLMGSLRASVLGLLEELRPPGDGGRTTS